MKKLLAVSFWKDAILNGIRSGYEVLKWMLPAVIVVRILEVWGAAEYIGRGFAPFMQLMGLPEWTGLVWVTAIFSNLYGGLAILVFHSETSSLSVAQMSILCTAMLIAHSLPVEARITRAFGVKFWYIIAFRLLGAFVLCILLNLIYSSLGVLSEPVNFNWSVNSQTVGESNIISLIIKEATSLALLGVIVVLLVIIMEVLKQLRVVYYCELLMQPLLRFIGISPGLSHIMAVGGLLGLTYGSGLLIAESRKNNFNKRELAVALVFISMCHALIEDTMLMILAGSHLSAVLFGRFFFCLLVAVLLMRWRASLMIKFYT